MSSEGESLTPSRLTQPPCQSLAVGEFPMGETPITFQIAPGTSVSADTPVTITATPSLHAYGDVTTSATLMVEPAGATASVSPADSGPAECVFTCSQPVNISNGNVWVVQRDYSLPGLGGGMDVTRTWNGVWQQLRGRAWWDCLAIAGGPLTRNSSPSRAMEH